MVNFAKIFKGIKFPKIKINHDTWIGNIFKGIGSTLGGIIGAGTESGDAIENWFRSKSGSSLTEAQRQQNQFDHDEAELAYQRQIDYYNQFQSPDAMMRQYQSAGLNPALMMTSGNEGLSSAPSVPQASGSSAGSQTASLADIVQLLSFAKLSESQVNKNNSEAAKNNAEAENAEARTEGQNITNQWLPTQYQTNVDNMKANTDLALSKIESEAVNRDLMRSDISLNDAKTALTLEQAYLAHIDSQTRAQLNDLEVQLKQLQTRYEDARIRYTNAITVGAWTEVRKANEEIKNIQAEREKIVAETDRIHEDSYNKWLDNSIKEQTLPDVVRKSHYENSDDNLRKDWDWQHTSNLVRNVKGAIGVYHEAANALGEDFITLSGGWSKRYESGNYTVGRRR